MKRGYFITNSIKLYLCAIMLLIQIISIKSNAQLVSGNAFLQGNYVEVGIAPCGSFGSSVGAPAGYHPRGRGTQLGFVADPAKDGWTVGSPNYVGDYFLPGSPEEGWGLTINGVNYNNNQICGETGIPGSIANYSSSPAEKSATWQGSIAGLSITAKTTVPVGSLYFTTTVSLTNTSGVTLNNIYYMRNVDPDHGASTPGAGPTSSTTNCIVNQNPNSSNKALVSAIVAGHYLGLGSLDSRARVAHGGFSNRRADWIWNATGLNSSGCVTADQAIAVAFKIESLTPGESTTFSYVYVLDQAQLEAGLASTLGAVTDITCSSATFKATSTKNGTGYWMVVPLDATAPTAVQIKNGVNYGSVVVVASGSGAMTANVEKPFNITGLQSGTPYDIYFVSEDATPSFSAISKAVFTSKDTSVWYQDLDGDGYGTDNKTVIDCFKPAGFSDKNTDCNDANPGINPGATEVVGNHIDDNCDGLVDRFPYCIPEKSSNACTYMWITNVTTSGGIVNFNNSSDCSSTSYTDYSSFSVSQKQGNMVNMSFTSQGYALNYSVWIDFNDDGLFASGERVIAYGNSGNLTVSTGFTVPAGVSPGTYKMRVRADYNGYAAPSDPCAALIYGETEDYALTVLPACEAPALTACPVDITVNNDPGLCGANVTFAAATATGTAPAITYSHASGSLFPVGITTITATATNECGTATCSFTVTVEDKEAPLPDISELEEIRGECAVTVSEAPTATDKCEGKITGTTNDDLTYTTQGTHTITWTFEDGKGNKSTQTQKVVIADVSNPKITAPPTVTDHPMDAGKCYATVDIGTPTTEDNCGVASVTNDAPVTFPKGTTTVTWTVTDVNGRTSTATQTVNVVDNQIPTITAPADMLTLTNDPGKCHATIASLGTPETNDNCGIDPTTISNDAPPTFPIGTTLVHWTARDINGNAAALATQTISVVDNEKPVITTNGNKTVSTDAGKCGALVVASATAADNCTVGLPVGVRSDGKALDDLYPVGVTTITWTVSDMNGNAADPVTQTITVADTEAPGVKTQNLIVLLDVNGRASITESQVDAGSSDACGIKSMSLDKYEFTCANLGTNTISLTVTDENGNSASASALVTVKDEVAPVVLTKNVIIQLDVNGQASITVADVNDGSSDACGIKTWALSKTSFDCSELGSNIVTLTVTDVNGNTSSNTATVTVEDKIAPTITCVPAYNFCSYDKQNVPRPPASDNTAFSCELDWIVSRSDGKGENDPYMPGSTTITWTVTDAAGNQASCQTIVNVNQEITVSIADVKAMEYAGLDQNTVYLGYAPASSVTLAATAAGGNGNYRYSWSPVSGSNSSIVVSPTTPGENVFTVRVNDGFDNGRCSAAQSITLVVKDARCGSDNTKVNMCHVANSNDPTHVKTICIDGGSVLDHLKKGCRLNDCLNEGTITTGVATEVMAAGLALKAMPNPSTSYFTLKVETSNLSERVVLRVMDIKGRLVEMKQNVQPNQTLRIGDQYRPGIYFIEVMQGAERTQTKIIKMSN